MLTNIFLSLSPSLRFSEQIPAISSKCTHQNLTWPTECGDNRINMSERIADSSKPDDSVPLGDPKQAGLRL